MLREIGIIADHDAPAAQILGVKLLSVDRQDEECPGTRRHRAGPECRQSRYRLAFGTDLDVDVAALEHATKVGVVRCPRAQTLDRRRPVAEGLEKRERKLAGLEGLSDQLGNRFLDLDGVHGSLQIAARIRNRNEKSHCRALLRAWRRVDRRPVVPPFTNPAAPNGNDAP